MKYFLILLTGMFVCGFSIKKPINTELNLSDTLFAFQNCHSSRLMMRAFVDPKVKLYELDSAQIRQVTLPIFGEHAFLGYRAYFISKQDKIGEFTPIVIFIKADDYGGLWYILLDKNNRPCRSYILDYIVYMDYSYKYSELHSFISDSTIDSYELRCKPLEDFFAFKLVNGKLKVPKRILIIDSVTYKAVVNSRGIIKEERMDSVRYNREIKID